MTSITCVCTRVSWFIHFLSESFMHIILSSCTRRVYIVVVSIDLDHLKTEKPFFEQGWHGFLGFGKLDSVLQMFCCSLFSNIYFISLSVLFGCWWLWFWHRRISMWCQHRILTNVCFVYACVYSFRCSRPHLPLTLDFLFRINTVSFRNRPEDWLSGKLYEANCR